MKLGDRKFVFLIDKVFCRSYMIGKVPSKKLVSQEFGLMIDERFCHSLVIGKVLRSTFVEQKNDILIDNKLAALWAYLDVRHLMSYL